MVVVDAVAQGEAVEESEVVVEALGRALDHLAAVLDQAPALLVEELDQALALPLVAVRVHRPAQRLEVRRPSVIQVARTTRKLPLKLLDPTTVWDNVLPRRLGISQVLVPRREPVLRKGSRMRRRGETTSL